VTPHHVYPSTESMVAPNRCAAAGLPYGGRVTYAGVPYRLLLPDANRGEPSSC